LLGVPKGPIEGRDACLRKIDNVLAKPAEIYYCFSEHLQAPGTSHERRPTGKWKTRIKKAVNPLKTHDSAK